jgi:sec-independent protein translocase protein TatC
MSSAQATPSPADAATTPPVPPRRGRNGDGRMSFFDHLRELRRRLVWSVAVLFVLAVVSMEFSPQMFEWLRGPLSAVPHQKLIVLSPIEMYLTYLKLALMAAVFLGSPFLLLQIWLFVAPGLYPHEKKWIAPFVILGSAFFISGALFAFYLVLPIAFKAVVEGMPVFVESQYSVEIYFELVTKLMLAFGVVFELPLIMWILSAAGIVDPKTYGKIRRYWIVGAFIVAAILTPPDPFTQSLMAVPLLAFYEIGALGAKIMFRKRAEKRRQEQELQAASTTPPAPAAAP